MSCRYRPSLFLVLFVLLPACGPSFSGHARPQIETWQVTHKAPPATAAKKTRRKVSSSAPSLQGVRWKEITINQTSREDIEKHYGAGKASHGRTLYQVGTIPASIAFDDDGLVRSIRIIPPIQMDEGDLLAAYGKADRERRSDDFVRFWEYDRQGMTIEFAPDDLLVAGIEYRPPTLPAGSPAANLSDTGSRAPSTQAASRPALTNVAKSFASVKTAIARSGQGLNWVRANEEYSQAQKFYGAIHRQVPIVTDTDMQRYLNGLMDRLTSVTPKPPFPWTIRVIDSTTLNAMNLGGGIILLHSGLFKHLGSEAQLAYVIAHEMGHQIKRHVATGQTRAQLAQLLLGTAMLATAGAGHTGTAQAIGDFGSFAAHATLASFNRSQELEADDIGLYILSAAEYDTREAEKVMEKFIDLEGLHGRALPLFATHPDPRERLAQVQKWRTSQGEDDESETKLVTTQEFEEFKSLYRY